MYEETININSIFPEIKCKVSKHNNQNIVGFCVDPQCKDKNKLLCLDCIFYKHQKHSIVKINEIEDNVITQLNILQKQNENIIYLQKVKEITEVFNEFELKIVNHLKEALNDIKEKMLKNLSTILDYQFKTYFLNNNNEISIYTPQNENEEINFSEQIKLILNNKNEQNNNLNYLTVNEKINLFELKLKYIKNIKKEEIDNIINFQYIIKDIENINNNIFKWKDESTNSHYQYLYRLSSDKKTAVKKLKNDTITVLLGNTPFNQNENYYIEYLVNYKNGGNYHIGFGVIDPKLSCWGKTEDCYVLTEEGMFENKELTNKYIKIKDNIRVGFKINFKKKNFCELYINDDKCHEFKFNEHYQFYPFAAIRCVGNSVKVVRYHSY